MKLEALAEHDFGVLTNTTRYLKTREHDSLVIDKKTQRFYWNSQNLSGGLLTYLLKVRGMPYWEAKELAQQSIPYLQKVVKRGTSPVYPKLVLVFFLNGLQDRSYYYKRGLTDQTINHYFLGKYNDYASIPFIENNDLQNIQLRKENPKRILFYYKRKPGIYNADILSYVDEVFITEGCIDALILLQNKIPAVGANYISFEDFPKFKRQKKIYILFDNDEGGYNEALRVAKVLGYERCLLYLFQDFGKTGYDPVDFFVEGNKRDDLLHLVKSKAKPAYLIERR